jgi:hypothetical protein
MRLFPIFSLLLLCAGGCSDDIEAVAALDPRDNPVNETLNTKTKRVEDTVRQWNDGAVQMLSADFPICVAYAMPRASAELSPSLDKTLHGIAKAVKNRQGVNPLKLTIFQASYDKRPQPNDLTYLREGLPAGLKEAKISFHIMEWEAFRQRAHCNNKETILIAGNDIQFYHKTPPILSLQAGITPLDAYLFLEFSDA